MNSLETLKTTVDFYRDKEYSDLSDNDRASIDKEFKTGWLNLYNKEKAEGTLPQELAQYDNPEQLYDHYVSEAKKANPGLAGINATERVNQMSSHEYADNVERYKNSNTFKDLSQQEQQTRNEFFKNTLAEKRAAEGIEEPAPDFNANSSINNDTIKEWLNIEPENQPTETKKDLGLLDTTGTMIKAGAKSLARGVPNILSTGLGAAGYASDVLGKATGSDYLSDQGEMLSTLGNALKTSTRNLLPPEQKGAESLEEMWNRGLGGNLIALADEAPEQLLTWVLPYLASSKAVGMIEAAKKGQKAGKIMTAVNKALSKLNPEKAAKYAGLLGSMGLELSDIHQTELQEEGRMNAPLTTTLAGMAAGAMENIVPAGLLKLSKGWSTATRQALRKAASGPKELAKFALSQAGKNFLEEFSTEAAQTAIEQMAAKYNSTGELGISRKFGEAQQILKAEGIAGLARAAAQDKDLAEIFDAAVVGGITGGLGGGFHGAVDPVAYRASDMGRYYDYMKQRSDAIDAADYEKLSAANKAYDEYAAQSMGLQSLNGQQQAVLNSFQELVSDETSPEDKIEAMEVLSALGSAGYKNYKEWLTRNGWDFSGKTFLENEKALNAYMKQRAKAIIDMQSKALKQSAEQAAKQYGAAGRNIDANVFTPQQQNVAPAAANPVNNAAAVNTEDPDERNSYLDSLVNNALNIQPEEQKTGREESPESLNGLFSDEQKDIIGNTYVNMGQPMENGRGFIGNQAKLMAGDLETTCHYAVVEIDDLKVNEVQPRDRSGRLSSEDQIRRMAADFKPERVIDNSIDANNGPMVVNSDMQVESGNGRISALKMAYNDQTGDGEYSGAELDPQYGKAAKYKQTLMVRAKEFGISADQIAGMKRPVLVRIRDNDPKISKTDFAVKSNTSQSMVMSASEQAKVDAEFMRKFVDDFASMNLDSTANVPFLKQFLEQVCSPSELNDMFDAKQEHLSANGKTRILNALFAAAYGEDPDILSMLSEVGNPVVDKLIAALKEAAADSVKLAADVEGQRCYDVPLAKAIGEAVRKIRDIKSDPKLQGIIRDYGVAGAYYRQGLLNDDGMSPAGRLMLGILGGDYANNVKSMSDFIIDCNNVIRNAGNPKQPMLDGSYAPAPSVEDVVAAALKNNGYDQQTIDTWKQGPNIAAATGNTGNDAAYSVRNDGVTENQYHEDKWKKEYSKNNPDMKKVHAEDDLAHGQSMPANRETFAGDDIDFENLLDAIDDTGDPISFEELEREVDKIRKLIDPETGITIEVMHDSAELGKNAQKGGEGVNINGRVILFSDNLTKQNWKRKLAHEILGHSTAKMLLGSKHFRYALEGVLRLTKTNDKAKRVFHDILQRYQKMYLDVPTSETRRLYLLEELTADCFGYLEEDRNYFGKAGIFDSVKTWIRNKLRNWGMKVEVSDLEMRDLFKRSMEVATPEGSWKAGANSSTKSKAPRWSSDDGDELTNLLSDMEHEPEALLIKRATDELEGQPGYLGLNEDNEPRFSIATNDNINPQTKKTGRDTLENYLKKSGMDKADVKEFMKKFDTITAICRQIRDAVGEDGKLAYPNYNDWSGMMPYLDDKGKPVFSWNRDNSDFYKNTNDAGSICKKRRPLDALLSAMIESNAIGRSLPNPGQIIALQKVIRKFGLEIACGLCYVDTKRFDIGAHAEAFAEAWNGAMTMYQENPERFSEVAKDVLSRKAASVSDKIFKEIATNPSSRIMLDGRRLLASIGQDELAAKHPGIYSIFNSHGGQNRTKNSHTETPYNNDVLTNLKSEVGSKATRNFFEYDNLFHIGGARWQSFSDFEAHMFFDYLQQVAEFAAKKCPVSCYTKEDLMIKLFGETGVKFNMSLVPFGTGVQEVSESVYRRLDDHVRAPIIKSSDGRFKYLAYTYMDNRFLKEDGSLTNKMETTETFDPELAFELRLRPEYRGNVGTIAVGASDDHIWALLDDPRIDMIIPYHKSSINPVIAQLRHVDTYENYESSQNTCHADGSALTKKDPHFDYYQALLETGDPRKAAEKYKVWCAENDFIPKFDQFKDHPNYYKLLADYRMYDNNNEYHQQEEVKLQLPDNWLDIWKKGLDDQELNLSKLYEKDEEGKHIRLDDGPGRRFKVKPELLEAATAAYNDPTGVGGVNENAYNELKNKVNSSSVLDELDIDRKNNSPFGEAVYPRSGKWSVKSDNNTDEMDRLYGDLVRASEGGDEEARSRAERMADNQLRNKGYTRELYHGTRRADRVGNEFRKDRAQTGPMAFFTPDEKMADNYRDSKPDTSLVNSGDYDKLFKVVIDGKETDLSDPTIWNRLSPRSRNLIRQKAPHVTFDDQAEEVIYNDSTTNGTGGFKENLREARGNVIEALREEWLNSGNLWDREGDFLDVLEKAGVNEAFKNEGWGTPTWDDPFYSEPATYRTLQKHKNSFDTSKDYNEEWIRRLENWWNGLDDQTRKSYDHTDEDYTSGWDKRKWTFEKWVDYAKDDIANGTTYQWTSIPDFVTDFLKSEGYDSVDDTEGDNAVIPFEPEQIKKRGITYDDDGRLIPLSSRGDRTKKDIRWSVAAKKADPFYSNTVDAISNTKKLPAKAKAAAWQKLLKPFIHEEEDKWMGLSQWIQEHNPQESLTYDQILQYAKDNVVEMKEVNYRDFDKYDYYRELYLDELVSSLESGVRSLLPDDYEEFIEFNVYIFNGFDDRHPDFTVGLRPLKTRTEDEMNRFWYDLGLQFDLIGHEEYNPDRNYELIRNNIEDNLENEIVNDGDHYFGMRDFIEGLDDHTEIDGTRLSYTTEGLEDKREIAFVFPDAKPYYGSLPEIHFADDNTEGKAVMWTRFGTTYDGDGKKVLFIDEVQSQRHQDAKEKGGYKQTHDEAIVASAKARQLTEAARQRVTNLHINIYDRIQKIYDYDKEKWLNSTIYKQFKEFNDNSGWIIDANKADEETEQLLNHPDFAELKEKLGGLLEQYAYARVDELKAYQSDIKNSDVPDAPLRENWYKTALKRMLRYAAENDFDKIAITTGKQQSARYDLSTVCDEIVVKKIDRSKGRIKRYSYDIYPYKDGIELSDSERADTDKELTSLIGKQLAKLVIESDQNELTFSGDDLQVGGQGMSHFYDNVIPSWLKKYCKQWGASVYNESTEDYQIDDESADRVHVVEINDAMKESVMSKGQPMWSLKGRITRDPDSPTFATEFSGGGLVDAGLIETGRPVGALDFDKDVARIYIDNYGHHMVIGDITKDGVDQLVRQTGGSVDFLHASPVCKDYSIIKHMKEEPELNKQSARAVVESLRRMRPKAFTLEQVKGYLNSQSFRIILDGLEELGYQFDYDVYSASDYGGATRRERLILRAVDSEHTLPPRPRQTGPDSWWNRIEDLVDEAPAMELPPYQRRVCEAHNFDWQHQKEPIVLFGNNHNKVRKVTMDQPFPTITASGAGDEILVLPGGKCRRMTNRMLARIMGLPDDYELPKVAKYAHRVIGNGVPVELTRAVIRPVLELLSGGRSGNVNEQRGLFADDEFSQALDDMDNGSRQNEKRSVRRSKDNRPVSQPEFDFGGDEQQYGHDSGFNEFKNLIDSIEEDHKKTYPYDKSEMYWPDKNVRDKVAKAIPDLSDEIYDYEDSLSGYEELPAGLEAFKNIFNNEETADIDSALDEGDYDIAVRKLKRMKTKAAKTFYSPLADRLVGNINEAIKVIRNGEYDPRKIYDFGFNDFADARVKRLPHSPEEEREWRKTGAVYRHNRRRSEPTKWEKSEFDSAARGIKTDVKNGGMTDEERREWHHGIPEDRNDEWNPKKVRQHSLKKQYNNSRPEYGEDDYTRMVDAAKGGDLIDRERFLIDYEDYGEADDNETNGDRRRKFGSADKYKPRWSVGRDTRLDLNGQIYTGAEIEDNIRSDIESIIADNNYDAEIIGVKVVGSRAKGRSRNDSDLDILCEYSGSEREDDMFNLLNDQGLNLNGVKVDINPIRAEESGTMDQWLKRNYDYRPEGTDPDLRWSINSDDFDPDDRPDGTNGGRRRPGRLAQSDARWSMRSEPAPVKTGTGYAVFIVKKDPKTGRVSLHPKMIADNSVGAPPLTWLNADTATIKRDKEGNPVLNTKGRLYIDAKGKQLAWRPGKHLADYPNASQFASTKDGKIADDIVFFEVEYAADKDYQKEAWEYGTNENGKYIHSQAGLPYIPKNGFYKYRTNANPENPAMIITGAYRIKRALTDEEAKKINQAAGGKWFDRRGEPLDEAGLAALGIDEAGLERMAASFDYDKVEQPHDESDVALGLPGYKRGTLNRNDKNLITAAKENGQNLDDYFAEDNSLKTMDRNESDFMNKLKAKDPEAIRQMDEEYMAAIESNDMKKARKLVNTWGRINGYNVNAWHGSLTTDIDEFKTNELNLNHGSHFGSRVAARQFATDPNTNKVTGRQYHVKLNAHKPYDTYDLFAQENKYTALESLKLAREIGPEREAEFIEKHKNDFPWLVKAKDMNNLDHMFIEDEFMDDEGYEEPPELMNDFRSLLKEAGYDSITYENDLEDEGNTDYVIQDKNRIKLADVITRDDKGNIIPLSQRFDSNKGSIRWSVNQKLDSEYEAALNSGDDDKARKMLDDAAKKAGYTEMYYHGNREGGNIDVFTGDPDVTEGNDLNLIKGYFTDQESYAEDYTPQGEEPQKVYLDTRNFLWIDPATPEEMLEYLKENGVHDVKFNDFINDDEDLAAWLEETGEDYLDPWEYFHNSGGNLTHQLKKAGFNGVMWNEGNAGSFFDGTAAMPFSSELIKSADLRTVDDKGNTIPLSQRFNRQKDSVRWSIKDAANKDFNDSLRHFVKRDGKESFVLVKDKIKELKTKGKIVKFSQDEVDKISKELDLQHPDLSGSELLKAILKDALGKENVTFEINGNIIRAFISRKGYNHFGVFNNANKANKVFANKMADIINNSEYVYSTKNVPHKNNKATDVQCWDDFLSLTNINDDNFYVLFGLRKMQSEDRHQIYSLNIRSEDSIRYAQESKTDPIANYTDSKPSPNSSITEPEDSGKTDKRWSLKAATPEEKQTLKDLGFSDQELESDPIPTVTEEGRAGAETLVTVANQIIEGLIGDTRSIADRSKPDYLYHFNMQPDKTIETEFEMKRRNKIEKSMKQRAAEDGLILEHLDADKNLITGLIRKHIPAGALQDWALKKAARILAPFQAAKPVEAILYTIADNLMYDEDKKQMVIAPKRLPLDFSKDNVVYEYDPNTSLGTAALKYFNTLNDDFKKIIIDRAKKNNEYRKDFLERVIPYEKAKTYLAFFGRTKLNGVSEKTIEGRSRLAYSMIEKLEGKIDQIDYNNLLAQFEQINSMTNEQIGRQAGNINSIIADLIGNPNASATAIQNRLNLLESNKGIYGYVHHHLAIDPQTKSGKAFNALGKLGHPWLETIPGFNKSRSGYEGTKSLLLADIARSTKGITAEAANRWMADAEDQRGIPVDSIQNPEELPEGYEKKQKVIANFGRFRGKEIYLPDELFDTYKLVVKHEDLDAALRPFGEACDFINNSINRVNGAMLYAPSKAARDLIAVPFHLIEFLRDWSIKHPSEAYPAIKALWHGLKNSVSPEFWQSHTPESLGEYSESLIYNTDRKDKTWVTRMFDSIGNIFQKSVPVGSTLAAALGELNLSGAADIPLKRVLTTVGEDLADLRGLKGQERERFIYDLVNEYAFDTSDLPQYLAYIRGQYPTQMSSTLGALSRATVPFFGYTSRILKQMITDPVKKGMIPLAKRAAGKGSSKDKLYEEMANASRPFMWLALKALLASGLAGLLPWPKDEDESTAAHIQNAPGLDARARTQGRFYSGSSDDAEYWTSVKGMGHLEVADSLSDYITGKADTKDFAAEFLTIHPVISAMLHTIHYSSPYEESVSTWAKWGKTLAQIISPEWSTRFGPDLAKLIRMIARTNTIPENRKQNFFTAFFEQIGAPVGAVQYDRSGRLKTTKPALEALKLMGINVREIPFDIIRDTTRTELKRLESDSKKIEKLRDYREGKYGSKSEMEFLKQDFGGDFRSVAEAEDYYGSTAKREAGLVKSAVRLNQKGYWNDPEEEERIKRDLIRKHKEESRKPSRSRRRKTGRKPEKPLLATETKRINDNINRAIEYDRNEDLEEFNNLMNQIESGNRHHPRPHSSSAADQIENLINML